MNQITMRYWKTTYIINLYLLGIIDLGLKTSEIPISGISQIYKYFINNKNVLFNKLCWSLTYLFKYGEINTVEKDYVKW